MARARRRRLSNSMPRSHQRAEGMAARCKPQTGRRQVRCSKGRIAVVPDRVSDPTRETPRPAKKD